ncbi:MAG: glyoxalase [Terriglobia bacterium]
MAVDTRTAVANLANTARAMRPMVPAKDFKVSKQFYEDLGFQPRVLTDGLVEMSLGPYSFILQDYYVPQWADNMVMHLRVSDVSLWWKHIVALDLTSRYGVKTSAPCLEDWGLVARAVDPSWMLWRIAESPASEPS